MTCNRIGLAICLLACLPACRATYPGRSVNQTIAQICQKEYGVQVLVVSKGRTIGALIPVKNILAKDTSRNDLALSNDVLEKIEHVMLTVSRVTLSSEFKFDFFVVTARDAKTGVEVSFVRYLKDVRRLMTDDISRSDYFQRLLIETRFLPGDRNPMQGSYELHEYFLPEVLAGQIADRMRQQLNSNLVLPRLFKVENVKGEFVRLPGRAWSSGRFRLSLHFEPGAEPFTTLGNPDLQEAFIQLFLRTAQNVTRRYEFFAFEGMEIVDQTGRRLAYFDRKEFTEDTVNNLMELLRNIKNKTP